MATYTVEPGDTDTAGVQRMDNEAAYASYMSDITAKNRARRKRNPVYTQPDVTADRFSDANDKYRQVYHIGQEADQLQAELEPQLPPATHQESKWQVEPATPTPPKESSTPTYTVEPGGSQGPSGGISGIPLPQRQDTRYPWAKAVDETINSAISPLEKGMQWYEQHLGKPWREFAFKQDPLETLAQQAPGPEASAGDVAWHAAKEAGVGMLTDPLSQLGMGVGVRGGVQPKPTLKPTPKPVTEPPFTGPPKVNVPTDLGPVNPYETPKMDVSPVAPPKLEAPTRPIEAPVEPQIPKAQQEIPEPVVGQAPPAETASMWKKWWAKEKFKWGQELPVLRTTPQSPVISSIEGHHVWTEGQLEDLIQQPWAKDILHKYDGKQWKQLEEQAVKTWNDGGKSERAYQEAVSGLPPEFQQMLQRREEVYAIENEIRTRRGLDPIPRVHEPYFPRVTTQEWKEFKSVYGAGQGQGGTKTTVGGHQQSRYYETIKEGEAAGVEYKDPRAGWLSRELNGLSLQATDQMITGLEQAGVLHKTKQAALAASPTGKVQRIDGIPFGPEKGGWWVRTEEEAQFLRQNLKPSTGGDFTRLANTYLRTPSLVNPFPHLLKNMLVKYGLTTFVSKGQMRHLIPDVMEWKHKSDPATLARFEAVLPFSESGKNAFQIMQEQLPKTLMGQVEDKLSYMNKWSQEKIFRDWDPALRYAKWREYIRQGMTDQEAANHTWVDLVRYGTQSDRIDAWRGLPLNFFVPWRVGAIRTLKKSFDNNAVRTMAFVGLVDAVREIDARTNNRWVHMPQDYLERPLMELARGHGTGAVKTLIATTLAGPGGDYFIRTMETMMKDLQLKGETKDLKALYWGLAQVYDLVPEWKKYEQTGDPMHLVNMTTLFLLGRHSLPYGAPPRFGELVPESLLPSSPEAAAATRKGEVARGERPKPSGIGGMGKMMK